MIASRQPRHPLHGACPSCGQAVKVDPRWSFGLIVCPRCDRLIWWYVAAEDGQRPVLTAEFTHELLGNTRADSLALVELVMRVEEALGKIAEEDAAKMASVQDVLNYVKTHKGLKKSSAE